MCCVHNNAVRDKNANHETIPVFSLSFFFWKIKLMVLDQFHALDLVPLLAEMADSLGLVLSEQKCIPNVLYCSLKVSSLKLLTQILTKIVLGSAYIITTLVIIALSYQASNFFKF